MELGCQDKRPDSLERRALASSLQSRKASTAALIARAPKRDPANDLYYTEIEKFVEENKDLIVKNGEDVKGLTRKYKSKVRGSQNPDDKAHLVELLKARVLEGGTALQRNQKNAPYSAHLQRIEAKIKEYEFKPPLVDSEYLRKFRRNIQNVRPHTEENYNAKEMKIYGKLESLEKEGKIVKKASSEAADGPPYYNK